MSELNSEFVHRGYWINLSQGSVLGKTITTDTKTGTIVIALLAVCTTLATTHLWHILTFLYHQFRADGRPSDGLFRQQQALLRTMPNPTALMADSVKLFFLWRGKASSRKMLGHSLVQTLAGLLFTLGSLAAGIFSSYAVTSSNLEVLVNSPFCGLLGSVQGPSSAAYSSRVWDVSTPYAQECYQSASNFSTRCNVFVKPKIPFTTEDAPCPFASSMCTSPATSFDSGLLDVNDGFGLNLAHENRVRIRRKTTCAILSQEGRVTRTNASDFPVRLLARTPMPQEEMLHYHYGRRNEDSEWADYTFGISLAENNATRQFRIFGVVYREASEKRPIEFLPEIVRKDADTMLVVVRKGIVSYYNPVDDPMFSAHQAFDATDIANADNLTLYRSDNPVSILGCAEQFQVCAGDSCTELRGIPEEFTPDMLPGANSVQLAVAQLLARVVSQFPINEVRDLGATSFLAKNGDIAQKIPDNQWTTEVQRWVALVWSSYQTAISDFAVGPKVRDATTEKLYDSPPKDEGLKALCRMQKMRKGGGFVNINVFGLAFVITFAVTATILDISLLRFLLFMSKFRRALSPRIDRWIQDGVFQLQRRAYEAQGQGKWENLEKEVPVIFDGARLEDLPVESMPVGELQSKDSWKVGDKMKFPETRIVDVDRMDSALSDGVADKR